jgi:hypothetical protein
MKVLNNLYQHVNILSLDVVAGAVISGLFFAKIFHTSLSLYSLISLALTVWIIYTLDHLRDARSIRQIASTDRHRFHQKYFRIILLTVVVAMVIDLTIVWFLPKRLLKLGVFLWCIVLVYLVFQRYLKFLKEFFVACLYTSGILLPSLATLTGDLQPVQFIVIAKFFITALMNLLLFSAFDYTEDRNQQQHSFVTWFGPVSTKYAILILGLLNVASGLWLLQFQPRIAAIFILMNLMLLAILFFEKRLRRNNYYRLLGDSVFFVPVLYLI